MSYSFSFSAANKHEAKAKASAEFERVVQQQPVHRNDHKQALAATEAFIDVLPNPINDEVVNVTVYGSVTWRGHQDQGDIVNASVSVTAGVGPLTKRV